jgi:hypothetical protein
LRHRQVGKQRIGLEHHTDIALVGLEPGDVLAGDDDLAGARLLEAGDHTQHRRLAAARWPEEGDEFARLDVEVEILDHGGEAEGFSHMLDGEERLGHGFFSFGQYFSVSLAGSPIAAQNATGSGSATCTPR